MRRTVFTGPAITVICVAGLILILAASLYFYSMGDSPREQDRVSTADGLFSIIKPKGWVSKIVYGPPDRRFVATLESHPTDSLEVGDQLFVGRLSAPPDMDNLKTTGYVKSTFQGQDAMVSSRFLKGQRVWRAYLWRDGTGWFQLQLTLRGNIDIQNSQWWKYLESFRSNQAPTTAPGSGMQKDPI
jgi:hypothetical protein